VFGLLHIGPVDVVECAFAPVVFRFEVLLLLLHRLRMSCFVELSFVV
jgi:hypothetical protein